MKKPSKWLLRRLNLVEAAGIEPASANPPSEGYYMLIQVFCLTCLTPTDRLLTSCLNTI